MKGETNRGKWYKITKNYTALVFEEGSIGTSKEQPYNTSIVTLYNGDWIRLIENDGECWIEEVLHLDPEAGEMVRWNYKDRRKHFLHGWDNEKKKVGLEN